MRGRVLVATDVSPAAAKSHHAARLRQVWVHGPCASGDELQQGIGACDLLAAETETAPLKKVVRWVVFLPCE